MATHDRDNAGIEGGEVSTQESLNNNYTCTILSQVRGQEGALIRHQLKEGGVFEACISLACCFFLPKTAEA